MADSGSREFSSDHLDGWRVRAETRPVRAQRHRVGCFQRGREHRSWNLLLRVGAREGRQQFEQSAYAVEDERTGREDLRCVGAPMGQRSVLSDACFDVLEDIVRRYRLLAADFPESFVLERSWRKSPFLTLISAASCAGSTEMDRQLLSSASAPRRDNCCVRLARCLDVEHGPSYLVCRGRLRKHRTSTSLSSRKTCSAARWKYGLARCGDFRG